MAGDIKKWLAEHVSKAKRLEGGVHFTDVIPKNPVSRLPSELENLADKKNSLARY